MKKQQNKVDIYTPLDPYEEELEKFLEKGDYVTAKKADFEKTKNMLEAAAKNYRKQQETKSITLRVKKADLAQVKVKARQKGIPYQTLISLLLHQYLAGEMKIVL